MATFRIGYKAEQEDDTIEAEGVNREGDNYRFYDDRRRQTGEDNTVAMIPAENVLKLERTD